MKKRSTLTIKVQTLYLTMRLARLCFYAALVVCGACCLTAEEAVELELLPIQDLEIKLTPVSDPGAKPKPAVAPVPDKLPTIKFRPKNSGVATQRTAKATRGDKPPVNLHTITPAKSCLTISRQPTVFWFQDQPGKVKITLNDLDRKKTLFSSTTRLSMAAGVHRFRIAEIGIHLDPGVNYEWSVMYIINEDTPSANPVARGAIVVAKPGSEMKALLEGLLPGVERARILADHGIFYDALYDLSLIAGATPERKELKVFFDDFIRQTGARP